MKETAKKKSIIIGLGRSGIAVAKYLNNKGENVVILERSSKESCLETIQELNNQGIEIKFNHALKLSSFKEWDNQIKQVVIGPGISWDHPTLNKLRAKGIEVKSEIFVAWNNLKKIPWVGITGTNGKTTVTHMLHHVLKENLINSNIGGNVGKAACEIALSIENKTLIKPKWLIIELSSYQIESAPEIAPKIGIWTTLTPDHLERHGSIENYFKIKNMLLEKSKIRIYNADDEYLKNNKSKLPIGRWISAKEALGRDAQADFWITNSGQVMESQKELFNCSALNSIGEHNLQNLLLVTAAAREIGLSGKEIESAIRSFKGLPHRLEQVCSINKIEVFNDSKATNFDSSAIGLKAIQGPLILIAGGQSKKGDHSCWLNQIKEKVTTIILYGESRLLLKNIIKRANFKGEIYCFNKLDNAVGKSVNLALENKLKSILFSPACASFDQYKNFEERGEHFKKLINDCKRDLKIKYGL